MDNKFRINNLSNGELPLLSTVLDYWKTVCMSLCLKRHIDVEKLMEVGGQISKVQLFDIQINILSFNYSFLPVSSCPCQ